MKRTWHALARQSIPQLVTASRVAIAGAAIVAAIEGRFYLSATLITFGAATDGIDGLLSRWLGTSSSFGSLFDYFADYPCFVVAPWILTRGLLGPNPELLFELSIGLPLVTGAVRYARNGVVVAGQSAEARPLPGLGTIFFAFLPVAAVFLDARTLVGQRILTLTLTFTVVIFSLLMLTPVRYPKLPKIPGLAPVVIVLLVVMPFIGTRVLATAMLLLGLLFAALAPLSIRRRRDAADFSDAHRDGSGAQSEFLP